MKKVYLLLGASTLAIAACSDSTRMPTDGAATTSGMSNVNGDNGLQGAGEPKIHGMKDVHAAKPGGGSGSTLMTSHNGTILVTNTTYAIFWGSEWNSASFAGDKITGMDSFFAGFGGSAYAATNDEYTGTNGQVTSASTYLGHSIDATAAPSRALSVSTAVAEACKVSGNNPDPNGVYFIFTSTGAGHVSYCAWHSYGSCSNGKPVQVAYMPNIDGIAGCDPQDTYGTGHSQGLAAVANVTAHELSEAITDPRNGGWYDASGAENGDKCAWSFASAVTLKNSTRWKLQMEWSNAAFTAGTGFTNRSGEKGCLQG